MWNNIFEGSCTRWLVFFNDDDNDDDDDGMEKQQKIGECSWVFREVDVDVDDDAAATTSRTTIIVITADVVVVIHDSDTRRRKFVVCIIGIGICMNIIVSLTRCLWL